MARFFSGPRRQHFFAISLAFFLASAAGECFAQTNMSDFLLTRLAPCRPNGIIYTPSNSTSPASYWFTEFSGGAVGRIDTVSNLITEVGLTNNSGAGAYAMTLGPDGNVWFTEGYADRIAKLNPATSNYQEFQLSNGIARFPATILTGPDGNLWFTEPGLNRLAAISTNATTNILGNLVLVQESAGIRTNSQIYGLAVGPDSNLWFTETSYGLIGRYNIASNAYTEFALPVTNTGPFSIVTGSDGALWFTEYGTNIIGRITTNGQIKEFVLPILAGYPTPTPFGILCGPDGNIWFAEYNGAAIGRITPGGIITFFRTLNPSSYPQFLATGPDGNIWFTEYTSAGTTTVLDRIGLLIVPEALSLSAPSNIYLPPTTTLGRTLIASFQNSCPTNTVVISWGDGTSNSLTITNSLFPTNFSATANHSVTTNPVVVINSIHFTNSFAIFNTAPLGTNFSNGSYEVFASHTFPAFSNYFGNISVTDASNDVAFANITFRASPLLGISGAGNNMVLLYWSTNAAGVSLYQNSSVLTTNWTKVTNAIVVTNGLNEVDIPTGGTTNEYYRLQ